MVQACGTGLALTVLRPRATQTHLTALGVILNNDGSGHTIYGQSAPLGLFDGLSPAVTDVLIKYTYIGDANLDGKVDGSDYTKIDGGFTGHLAGWANGDFDYNGAINGSDYTLVDNAFNTQGASIAAIVASAKTQPVTAVAATTALISPTLQSAIGRSGWATETPAAPAAATFSSQPISDDWIRTRNEEL